MRKIQRTSAAAFAVAAAALVTLSLLPDRDQPEPVSISRPAIEEDRLDYEGGVLAYVADVDRFAEAVEAHQLVQLAAAEDARKTAERAANSRPTATPTAPTNRPSAPAAPVPAGSVWDRLAQCEAGGNWQHGFVGPLPGNPGRYSGGLMFAESTWNAYGRDFAPVAHQASREQQIVVAERILAASGWGAWPACSRKLGLR